MSPLFLLRRALGTRSGRLGVLVHASFKPLTLSQVFSSAGGALSMLIAAWAMEPASFAKFALLTLVSSMLVGLLRSALLQPALIYRRIDVSAIVPLRYALVGSGVICAATFGMAIYLGFRDTTSLTLLTTSAIFPALYDWMRYKAMSVDSRWIVAQADGLRLALILGSAASVPIRESSVGMQSYISFTMVLPLSWLVFRLPRAGAWAPYRRYSRSAIWQVIDFGFGQTLITLPLLVLGGTVESALIAGVRLAQSILGPLNLMFSAGTTNLIADGATRPELAGSASLIARASTLARLLTLASVASVGILIAFFAFSSLSLRGVDGHAVFFGLLLVGGSLITTGWSGVHAIVIRLLDHQAIVTIGRGVIAVLTVSSFIVGYLSSGTDGSLIAGFSALAVSTPVVFWIVMIPIYRHARSEQPWSGDATPDPLESNIPR